MKLFWSFWAILNLFHLQVTENLAGNLNCHAKIQATMQQNTISVTSRLALTPFCDTKTCLNSSATEYEEETCDLACETNFHTIVAAVVWCATIFRIQRMNPHFASKEIQIEKSGMYRTNSKIKNKLSQMSSFHKGMKIQKAIYWTVHKIWWLHLFTQGKIV